MDEYLRDYLLDKPEQGLRQFLYYRVPALLEAHDLKAAFALRDWFMSELCYSALKLLIPHGDGDADRMLKALLRREGGLWCAGAAELFALLLQVVHIPATTYMYGYQGIASLSHTTTVLSVTTRDENNYAIPAFYLLDAYLGFHYEDPTSHEVLELPKLLARICDRRYDEIKRVDLAIERPYVTQAGEDPAFRSWLFDRGIPKAQHYGKMRAYSGATYTVGKLFMPTTPMRLLADKRRGSQPLEHYLLDLMLVRPEFGRMAFRSETYKEGYTDWALMRSLVDVMAECCVRRP